MGASEYSGLWWRPGPGHRGRRIGRFQTNSVADAKPFCFWPVFDGKVLPKDPMQAARQGSLNLMETCKAIKHMLA